MHGWPLLQFLVKFLHSRLQGHHFFREACHWEPKPDSKHGTHQEPNTNLSHDQQDMWEVCSLLSRQSFPHFEYFKCWSSWLSAHVTKHALKQPQEILLFWYLRFGIPWAEAAFMLDQCWLFLNPHALLCLKQDCVMRLKSRRHFLRSTFNTLGRWQDNTHKAQSVHPKYQPPHPCERPRVVKLPF